MPSVCMFQLNRANATYFSGETILGTITLETTSDKNVRDVSIIFCGEGKVKWQETHSTSDSDGRSSSTTVYFKSHEIYIDNRTLARGDGVLPAGTWTFTFNITLPWECPTSFEGKYGHIRYELSLKLNRYYRFDNIYKRPVTVIKTVDLNLNPTFKVPIVFEALSTSCCWPCSKGKIFSTLSIPYGAYAPGQVITCTLHLSNQSMDDTEGFSIELRQKVTFTARSPHRKERYTKNFLVSRAYPEKCLRLANRVFEKNIVIPSTPPTTNSSSIICVEYWLKVTVNLSCCISDPDLILPIIIGTIPIRESLPAVTQTVTADDRQQLVPTAPQIAKAQIESSETDLPPSYNEIRPNSFVEPINTGNIAPFIDNDVDERNRIVDFRPLYPMYNSYY